MVTRGFTIWQIYAAGTLACAALCFAMWTTVIQPGVEQRQHVADLRAELGKRRQSAQSYTRLLAADRVRLASLHDDFEHHPLHLEPAERVNQRLAAVNELASLAGLTLQIHPGGPADATHYKMLPFHIEGTGTYPACADFLHRLRGEFPDTAVASLEAVSAAAATGVQGDSIGFKLDLIWYTQK